MCKIKSTATCSDVRPRFHRQPPTFRYEHHFPQGQCASKSVQSLEATILDPQVLIGGYPSSSIPSTSLLHLSTSFHILLHPSASFHILVLIHHLKPSDTNTPFVQPIGIWRKSVSAFQNLFKAWKNHSRPPDFWLVLSFSPISARRTTWKYYMEGTKSAMHIWCTLFDRQLLGKKGGQTPYPIYKFVREIKFPQSTNPRGDYFLNTNALARQWHREFF